ncbi:hypothetical protein C1752_01141 [Acaryochloris thomasi RCC1774]|uniref:DUF192 domain-containing protein n=1 Tax=Acaryochloris thomasi RCC1774 TaxID=1764569 RepID=A0A2W1JM05_9CYAN|nr:DUF192 domain-containing protein [Acaryochloris thomasi]PZD74348.1 hypothetical protein C1752_01141 [Acaryochloris thomasi RCC1774]
MFYVKLKRLWPVSVAVSGLLLLGCQSLSNALPDVPAESAGQFLPITAQAVMADQMIELEVARTGQQQATGLMHREPLPDNRGMLFPFPSARKVGFWMKNVPVPLDMVFLHQGQVVGIQNSAPPCTNRPCPVYGPQVPVDQVIELRAGRANELGLQVGDSVAVKDLEAQATP